MERQTVDVILPESKAKFVLYTYLTFGEQRQIKRVAFDTMHLKINAEKEEFDIKEITGGFKLDADDLTVKLLTKEACTQTGEPIVDVASFISNLSITDGNFLYDEVDKITQGSVLTIEARKK